ncbi:MAG: aspartyl/asparaginyl beta-hydroxylase domain-containing protein [Halieaceae bacterium]|nr:aspartyl/asparaginyl beta-hydroxylase domain-containing protein [Halieaceae bacterium]
MNSDGPASETIGQAQALLRAGDRDGALALLSAAVKAEPGDHDLQLNLAMTYRAMGDLNSCLSALNAALAADPYSFLALLSKGSVLEQLGKLRLAATVYRDALRIAPPEAGTPPSLKAPIARARQVVAEQADALARHLRDALAPELSAHASSDLARFEESLDVLAGIKKVYNAEPVQLHYPRLPAIPFFDRSHFPWMDTLEAATDVIREELVTLLDAGLPGFKPYVQYAPGTPENQFAPLNHNSKWSSLWLWKDGVRQEEAIARCPETTAILEELPLCDQPGFAPTALFSALAPHTRIPPHTGSTNTRLLVHLPLVLPGPAGFRVGNDTREWRMGEAWAFDDTIEHEAWNDADETRVIMIFDIWNPLLSDAERDLARKLLTTHNAWLNS